MEVAQSKLDIKLTQLKLAVEKTESVLGKGNQQAIERHLNGLKVITGEVEQSKRVVEELKIGEKVEVACWGNASYIDGKLPKIEIPQFDGSPLDWPRFWGQFIETVDKRFVAPVNKFAYLCGFLSPKVKTVIEGLPFTPEGYNRAKSILENRYGKNSEVIKAYVKLIMNLPVINEIDLERIHKKLERYLRPEI